MKSGALLSTLHVFLNHKTSIQRTLPLAKTPRVSEGTTGVRGQTLSANSRNRAPVDLERAIGAVRMIVPSKSRLHTLQLVFGSMIRAACSSLPTNCLFLRGERNDRLSRGLASNCLGADALKQSFAIRMLRVLVGLAAGLPSVGSGQPSWPPFVEFGADLVAARTNRSRIDHRRQADGPQANHPLPPLLVKSSARAKPKTDSIVSAHVLWTFQGQLSPVRPDRPKDTQEESHD